MVRHLRAFIGGSSSATAPRVALPPELGIVSGKELIVDLNLRLTTFGHLNGVGNLDGL